MKMIQNIGRFAPTPSGYLHMGNLMTTLLTWLDIRKIDGQLVFRLEDLDRYRLGYEFSPPLFDDLKWLGLDWDIGWNGDASSEYCQANRSEIYEKVFNSFMEKDMVYPCYCSRNERLAAVAPHIGDSLDFGCKCKHLSEDEKRKLERNGKKPSWKIKVPDKNISFVDGHYGVYSGNIAQQGDFIIRRSDGVYAYQLATSVDDVLMGVTRVVRGRDLISSSIRQIWLIQQLGGTVPEYIHVPLIVTENGRKLSKREGDLNMETFRKVYTPEKLIGMLSYYAGLTESDDEVSLDALINGFSWEKVKHDDILIN